MRRLSDTKFLEGSLRERIHLGKRRADPYEFDDDNHQALTTEGPKRKDNVKVRYFDLSVLLEVPVESACG